MALPCVNGCYLPKQETEFIHTVLEELDEFQKRNDILLFPPVPSRLRFLIHQTCSNHPNLSTFSVGEACARRVVVCYSDLSNTRSLEPSFNSRQRARRPDKAIYIPRAVRHKIDLDHPNLKESSEESRSDVTKEPLVANQKPEVDSTGQSPGDEEFVQLSRSGPSPWPPAWDQTVSFFTSLTLDDETDEKCANNTFLPTDATLQQQDVDESLLSEIKAKLKHGDISILNTGSDFPAYANIWLDPQEFGHIIEIYNFPAMFKTDDLLDAFLCASVSSDGGMKIKWVDNTHALGVFASQSAEFIQPVKERPRTDTVVARRMVTRALGLRGRRSEIRNNFN
uniref:R3H domain and coiled-coil containing 1 n=1 Tax=Cyprinus carpio TaxID=7962 RepID=A0A8C2Q386_CYPCA